MKPKFITITFLLATFTFILGSSSAAPAESAPQTNQENLPWWRQQKISFHWGQWWLQKSSPMTTDQLMQNLARVGATVYADGNVHGGVTFNLDDAKAAHKYGLKYFGSCFAWKIADRNKEQQGRVALGPDGKVLASAATHIPLACPIQPQLYDRIIFSPAIEAARTGLVDGMHFDWEGYAKQSEPTICYCDSCFGAFLKHQGLANQSVTPAQRGTWLNQHHLAESYWKFQNQRRFDMWHAFAIRIHKVKPAFLFSVYMAWKEAPEAMVEALQSPEAPVIIVDHRYYYPDQPFNWWDSLQQYFHKQGYLYIAGTYDNGLFGGQPQSAVEASQWLYDAALNSDGTWVWFEEEMTPALWRTFQIANRRTQQVQSVAGEYLLQGKMDDLSVTPVEQTGNPRLRDKLILRTYHLNDEYLVHVSNVDLWLPLTVTLRFPSLAGPGPWSVRDPLSKIHYSPDGQSTLWTAANLSKGPTLALPKRSDLFLLISPAPSEEKNPQERLINASAVEPFPTQPETISSPSLSRNGNDDQLLFTATRPMGFAGVQGKWAIANAILLANNTASNPSPWLNVKGRLWSPSWSPDGKHIAFSYDANGRGQIFASNGDQSTNLSHNAYCDRSPLWSPDGRKLAFISDRDGNWNIYVQHLTTRRVQQLTRSAGINRDPVWSPDGKQLAFETSRDGDWKIYLMRVDGSNQRPLQFNWPYDTYFTYRHTGNQLHPTWSPDGQKIACTVTGDWYRALRVVDVNTGKPVQLLENYPDLDDLHWSPDGTQIAGTFVSGPFQEKDPTTGLFTIDADGKNFKALIRASALKTRPGGGTEESETSRPSWYSSGAASQPWTLKTFSSLCWSPDGKQFAFSSDMDGDGYFRIYTINRDGTHMAVVKGSQSAWPQKVQWKPHQ
jgi:Tol biopolymer transport system component